MVKEWADGRGDPVAFFTVYRKEPEAGPEEWQSKSILNLSRITSLIVIIDTKQRIHIFPNDEFYFGRDKSW
jgi:hypothetical protein